MSISSPTTTGAVAPLDESQRTLGDSDGLGDGSNAAAAQEKGHLSRGSSGAGGAHEGGEGGPPGQPNLLRRLSTALQFQRKGSQTPLPTADEIPANFLKACKGNVEKAGKKWLATRQWRDENDIDHILEKPHPHYNTLKEVYPAYLHGKDLLGNVISVEIPGMMDVRLMRAQNLTPKDMALQMALTQEYVWNVLTPGDEGKITTLMDAKGLSLTRLASPDSLALIRIASETLNNHYPERVLRILIVNAPRFFGPMFKLLSSVMPASIRDQLQICYTIEDLEKFISIDAIPQEYGGKSPYKLGEAEEERGLREMIEKYNTTTTETG